MPSAPSKPNLAALPSVDEIMRSQTANHLLDQVGRRRLTQYARAAIAELRAALKNESTNATKQELIASAETRLEEIWRRSRDARLRRVINATGVVIHTNLGRAPLSDAARDAMIDAAGYCNIEYDLTTGSRGGRGKHVESLICQLTGAEDAIVVNNCAAAAYLVLTVLAVGHEVVISRGELVEIGGEFRVPDVLARAGVTLKEVGTTNRTNVADYEKAINASTAMILRVHPSNYRIVGFTASPSVDELAQLAHSKGIVFYEDAGSGAVTDLSKIGLLDDPVVGHSLQAGADLVTFSGDKLLGGPQAGLIIGKRDLIEKLRKDPLYRALRVSKLIFAALEATLDDHVCEQRIETVPVLRMLAADAAALKVRCKDLIEKLDGKNVKTEIIDGRSAVGGGAAPMTEPETPLIAISHSELSATELESKLRSQPTPIVARITDGRVVVDLRTVSEEEMPELIAALHAI